MTSVASGGGATSGTLSTACTVLCIFPAQGSPADSSAKETEGARVHDVGYVTTGDVSPVGAEREQTVAGRSARVHDVGYVTTGDVSPVGAEREQTVAGRSAEVKASQGI
jgi:hypothetical protein